MLIGRLSHIQTVFKNIVLRDRIDQVGDVSAGVNVFADSGRADILKMLREMQIDDLAADRITCLARGGVPPLVRTAFEDDMIQRMNRILPRLHAVAGSVFDDIAARDKIELFAREQLFELRKVCRIGNVDRKIVRKNIDVFFIGDRHAHDLAALQARLRLFGPAEFVERQIDFAAHVADFAGDGLVAETERVEGSREKSHLFWLLHSKGADLQLIVTDKAV